MRVRIERQLGYKMAKYIMRIELVDTFAVSPTARRVLGRSRLRVVRGHLRRASGAERRDTIRSLLRTPRTTRGSGSESPVEEAEHRGGRNCGSLTVDPSLHDNPSHGARVGTELPKSQLFSSCADGHAAQPDKGMGQEKGPFFKMVRAGGGMPEANARHWKRKRGRKGRSAVGHRRMVDTLGSSPGTVLLIRTGIAPGTTNLTGFSSWAMPAAG